MTNHNEIESCNRCETPETECGEMVLRKENNKTELVCSGCYLEDSTETITIEWSEEDHEALQILKTWGEAPSGKLHMGPCPIDPSVVLWGLTNLKVGANLLDEKTQESFWKAFWPNIEMGVFGLFDFVDVPHSGSYAYSELEQLNETYKRLVSLWDKMESNQWVKESH